MSWLFATSVIKITGVNVRYNLIREVKRQTLFIIGAVTQKAILVPANYCNSHLIAVPIPSRFLKSAVKIQLQNN